MKEKCIICYWLHDYYECHKRAPIDSTKKEDGRGSNMAIWPRIHNSHDNGCGDWKLNEEIRCPFCEETTTLYTIEKKKCFFCMKEWNGVS